MQDEQLQVIKQHLTRIEAKVDGANARLDKMNGTVQEHSNTLRKHNDTLRNHKQTLYGHDGRGGLRETTRRLWQRIDDTIEKVSHMSGTVEGRNVTTRTAWTAIMALGGIAAVVVALVVGLL